MVGSLSHIHRVISINADAGRPHQFSIVFATFPKFPQKRTLCCEHLNAVVFKVSYIHIPTAIKRYTPGMFELSVAAAAATKAAGECHVRVQNLNAMIAIVCYVYFLVVLVDGDAPSEVEFQILAASLTHY